MKIQAEKIIFPAQSAFKLIKYSVPYFNMGFHHHPEYELVYITHGSGVRNIGNSVHKYQAGDMVFLGPDLAHVWLSSQENRKKKSRREAEAIVLQFSTDLLRSLINTPEFFEIKNLFSRAPFGIQVGEQAAIMIGRMMRKMLSVGGVDRVQGLIKILDIISRDEQQALLNDSGLLPPKNKSDGRINSVHQFVVSCYARNISSRDGARVAKMEHSAFCRLFKAKTKKTFTQVLNEKRIDQACQRLLGTQLSVTQIAYEVGYSNLGHFYKQFKNIMGTTPVKFKSQKNGF
ncbi:MAG: AraC family transcriptional regulator [Candidatus Marinimicrobia bacterium]|nr:AraC family transcriptional regulator [Candidatus Neomarinimicrobiota bacterium]MCF7922403.1 AraC family transcriptional regulator [Candidatus Neomarinimicrobiota bacterium]